VRRIVHTALWAIVGLLVAVAGTKPVQAQGNLQKVKHIIVVMQENHSFDNYFGALAYAPGSPYHGPGGSEPEWFDRDEHGGCREGDHRCVDGLSCLADATGELHCFNANIDEDGHRVFAFHDSRRCVLPDLDHSWLGTHQEANFFEPNDTLRDADNNGFVLVNDKTEQLDKGVENATEDQTMNFYNQDEIPFYYDLAEKFAIDDRYFASVLGPTFPNRSYALAATSFGHLTTSDTLPPPGGYRPITGTIFDLLDKNNVTWGDYFQDAPGGGTFRPFGAGVVDPHFLPLKLFLTQAAGVPGVPALPEVSFVDPNFGLFGIAGENDEHPPTDIQRGQAFVSQIVNAVRNGPNWKDSIILITYDEHGGSYDYVHSPEAPQGHQRTPDGISPGQCADLSNAPASLQPGGGAECSSNPLSKTDTTVADAEALCSGLTANPTGPYPANCASFDQLGIRVPFIAVSPFSKPHYVSHTTGDHTSILALIEQRFLNTGRTAADDHDPDGRQHLTLRDQHANTLEDLFDFDNAPSINTPLTVALPPAKDCTPAK
jgi:phospholipase C